MFRKRRPASRASANAETSTGSNAFCIRSRKVGSRRVGLFERLLNLLFQGEKTQLEIFVAERLDFGLERVDGRNQRLQFFDVALVLGADKSRNYAVYELCCIHE